jgi:hypothetical protein
MVQGQREESRRFEMTGRLEMRGRREKVRGRRGEARARDEMRVEAEN